MPRPDRLLALETSGTAGSIALIEQGRVIAFERLDHQRRSTVTLAPAIQAALRQQDWRPDELGAVAVVVGPGSFTGLRVGIATAKVLAYALSGAVIGIETHDVLAEQAPAAEEGALLSTVVDAFRQELFVRRYRHTGGRWQACEASQLVPIATWLDRLERGERLIGPGLVKLRGKLDPARRAVSEGDDEPRADVLGLLGWDRLQRGECDDPWSLSPRYQRLSAAEERRAQPAP